MTDEELAEERATKFTDINFNEPDNYGSEKEVGHFSYRVGFLAGLEAGRPKWHDLRKDPKDLPIGEVNLDTHPYFMKYKVQPRIKVVVKIGFKGYEHSLPWENVLYYEDGKWLAYHYIQGTRGLFKEIPKCEYVIAWCEIPVFEEGV